VNNNYNSNTVVKHVNGRAAHMTDNNSAPELAELPSYQIMLDPSLIY
jgi:hypothetical protein